MKYGIITPAYNEAGFLEDFMHSVIMQSCKPDTFLIVDDGSTDETAAIAKQIASEHEWISVITRPGEARYQIGSKVVDNFNYGLDNSASSNWDFVVKLDADQILPPDYFEKISRQFRENPDVGICGGVCAVPVQESDHPRTNGATDNNQNPYGRFDPSQLKVEKLVDRFHVRGSIKSYRMACFKDINGLRSLYGWDTLDELLAEYHGWRIEIIPELKVIHRRPTGTKTATLHLHIITGEMFYRLGYGPLISFLASAKRYRMSPFVISALMSWAGYIRAAIRRDERYVSRDEMRFIRKLRYRRMKSKLLPFSKPD